MLDRDTACLLRNNRTHTVTAVGRTTGPGLILERVCPWGKWRSWTSPERRARVPLTSCWQVSQTSIDWVVANACLSMCQQRSCRCSRRSVEQTHRSCVWYAAQHQAAATPTSCTCSPAITAGQTESVRNRTSQEHRQLFSWCFCTVNPGSRRSSVASHTRLITCGVWTGALQRRRTC